MRASSYWRQLAKETTRTANTYILPSEAAHLRVRPQIIRNPEGEFPDDLLRETLDPFFPDRVYAPLFEGSLRSALRQIVREKSPDVSLHY